MPAAPPAGRDHKQCHWDLCRNLPCKFSCQVGCVTPLWFSLTQVCLFPPFDPAAVLAAEGLKEFRGRGGGDEVFQMLITHCQLPPKSY